MILVDNGGGNMIDFGLGPGRHGVNGVAEGIDRQRQQDRVGADAVQLLQAQGEDMEQLPDHLQDLLFPEHERRHTDEENRKDRERQVVQPELGESKSFGERADADLLEP